MSINWQTLGYIRLSDPYHQTEFQFLTDHAPGSAVYQKVVPCSE